MKKRKNREKPKSSAVGAQVTHESDLTNIELYFDIFWSSQQFCYIQWLMKIISWIAHLWHEMRFVRYYNKIILLILIIIINICQAWRIYQENMSRDMIYFCLILWFWECIAWLNYLTQFCFYICFLYIAAFRFIGCLVNNV